MLDEAKFFQMFFSKANSKGFKFIQSDEGFIVTYPSYSIEQAKDVTTNEEFSKVVLDVFNWK